MQKECPKVRTHIISLLLLSLLLGIGALGIFQAPVAHAATGPTVYSSGTVVKGASNCNPNFYGPYTFTCAFTMAVQSGDLVVVAFQIAYYGGVTNNNVAIADSAGTTFTLTALCASSCYTIGEGFETGIYYGIASSSSSSDTITLTSSGTSGYSAPQSALSLTMEGYDVNFGQTGTPSLTANGIFNCKYQDYNNPNNCSGSNIPMNTGQISPLSYGSGAFLIGAIITSGNGVSGSSGFNFKSTACVASNYCYGVETANSDAVSSPSSFKFQANNQQGVYWGWAESAAVFTIRSGFASGAPSTSVTNETSSTLTPVPFTSNSSGYAYWVPIVTAVVGLVLGFGLAFAWTRMRKPPAAKPSPTQA